MDRTQEDIIEIKPGAYGFYVNVRALMRRLFKQKEKPDTLLIVSQRIFNVFEAHGVAVSQIPRLVSELKLSQLKSPGILLDTLTPEIIQKIADLFQVQRKWLEGTTDIIYDGRYYCYKDPWKFFKNIKSFKIEPFDFPLIAFTAQTKFNFESGKKQLVVLVQREKITELDGKDIYRYRLIDGFDWGYFKSRIQLKAMMRIWYKRYQAIVPIYHIDSKLLQRMEDGKLIPHPYRFGRRRLKHDNLEDFALTQKESAVSQESEDLPHVFRYIDLFKLENMKGKNPAYSPEVAPYV